MELKWPPLDKNIEKVLDEARLHAGQGLAEAVRIEYLLIALLDHEPVARAVLGICGVDVGRAREKLFDRVGRSLVERLLHLYAQRLQEKAIQFRQTTGVVDWLLARAGWREAMNPLNNLKHRIETLVADRLEELLLARTISPGQEIVAQIEDSGDSSVLAFAVNS